jgi:hypothetical protein
MSKLIVIAIGIANAAIFLAASVFIVAGDGATSNSAYMVWGLGFSWITIFLIQSLRLSVRKDNSAAIALSLSALPIGFAITLLSIYAK